MSKKERNGAPRRYDFKLYPTKDQEQVLQSHCKMSAELWNALLDMCETQMSRSYQTQRWVDSSGKRHSGYSFHIVDDDGESVLKGPPHEYAMGYWISELRDQCPEWRELSTWVPRRIANSLHLSYQAFFRRMKELSDPAVYEREAARWREKKGRNPTRFELAGYPKFRSSRRAKSIPHRFQSGIKLIKSDRHERSWLLYIKGVGEVWARGRFPAEYQKLTFADIIYRDGCWWLSACGDFEERRGSNAAGKRPVVVQFDLVDCLAYVDGQPQMPDGLVRAAQTMRHVDLLRSDFDKRWPRGVRLSDEDHEAREDEWREIARLMAYTARARKDALHVWTARLVAGASKLVVIKPNVREAVQTPHGHEKDWGANTKVVSEFNRNILNKCPSSAIAMIEYKAQEAGVPCEFITDKEAPIQIGKSLVSAGKEVKRLKRKVKHAQRSERSDRNIEACA